MKQSFYIMACLLLCLSCTDINLVDRQKITFDAEVHTKGENLTTENITTMCVSAAKTSSLFILSDAKVGNLIDNELVKKESDGWVTDKSYYYPASGYTSFFAYAPYISDKNVCNSDCDNGGIYNLCYTPATDVSKQVDLCVAKPILDLKNYDGKISFTFFHTLSKIQFYASYSGTLPENYKIFVEGITIENIYGSAILKVKLTYPYFEWIVDSESAAKYSLSRINGELTNNPVKSNEERCLNGSDTDGELFLIPQNVSGTAKLIFTIRIYEGEEPISETLLSYQVPDAIWEASNVTKYGLDLVIGNLALSVLSVSKHYIEVEISDD